MRKLQTRLSLTGVTVDEFTEDVKNRPATAKHPHYKRPYTELGRINPKEDQVKAICREVTTRRSEDGSKK